MSAKSARIAPTLRLVPGSGSSGAGAARPILDDSELLAALRAGDASAATALHDRMRPQVERTIGRLLGYRDTDREDVAQLSLLEIVSTIGRYRGDCSLDSWASTITAHVIYKHIRRRKTERRIFSSLDADALVEPRSGSRTGREAMVRSVMHHVLAHLDSMDAAKAWAFVLHDVCGYDLREMARITGVSSAAAQTRLVRGRREVSERIASDPELAGWLESIEGAS